MALPFTEEGLIMKSLDQPQAVRTGNSDYVFPLLVSLQNIRREAPKLPSDAPVLKDIPHTLNDIYVFWYVNHATCLTVRIQRTKAAAAAGPGPLERDVTHPISPQPVDSDDTASTEKPRTTRNRLAVFARGLQYRRSRLPLEPAACESPT